MTLTLPQWQTRFATLLSEGLECPVVHGNPNVGGDGALNCPDGLYVGVELVSVYETVEPWPSQLRDGSVVSGCATPLAADLTCRLVWCVPAGDDDGRSASPAELLASSAAVAAGAVEMYRLLRVDKVEARLEFGRTSLGPLYFVPKSGGASAAEVAVTVPLECSTDAP